MIKLKIWKRVFQFQIQELGPKIGKKALKRMKKVERDKTKGEGWFNMKAPEMTPELQNELDVLRMRSAIDPTRFYKKLDSTAPPKYFQVLLLFLLLLFFFYFFLKLLPATVVLLSY